MKLEVQNGLIRGLPLTILITLLLQVGGAVWWISARARDGIFVEQRLEKVESVVAQNREEQSKTIDRLARIEERLRTQEGLLGRIEKILLESRR